MQFITQWRQNPLTDRYYQTKILSGDLTPLWPEALTVSLKNINSNEYYFYHRLMTQWKLAPLIPVYLGNEVLGRPLLGSSPEQVDFDGSKSQRASFLASASFTTLADMLADRSSTEVMLIVLQLVRMYRILASHGYHLVHGNLTAANILILPYHTEDGIEYWPLLINFDTSRLQTPTRIIESPERTLVDSGLEDFYHLLLDILARYRSMTFQGYPQYLDLYQALAFFFPDLSSDDLSDAIMQRQYPNQWFFDPAQREFYTKYNLSNLEQRWKNDFELNLTVWPLISIEDLKPWWYKPLVHNSFTRSYKASAQYSKYLQNPSLKQWQIQLPR